MIRLLVGVLLWVRISECCTAFDGSSLAGHNLLNGVTDNKGIQTMLNRALGQQTHVGKTGRLVGLAGNRDQSSNNKELVYDAAELSCYDFDEDCRWKNMEGLLVDEMDWYQGSGFLDQGRLQVATGTHITPEGPYSIVATDHAQLAIAKAVLVSDPIACQIGPGEIRFRFWISPQVRLKVCTKKVTQILPTFDYCSPPVEGSSPGPAHLSVPDGGRESFQLFIVADNFVFSAPSLQGGFAIVDDIEYYADMCHNDKESPGPAGGTNLIEQSNGIQSANDLLVRLGLTTTTTTVFPRLVSIEEEEIRTEYGGIPKTNKDGKMQIHSSITRRGPLPHDTFSSLEKAEEERRKNELDEEFPWDTMDNEVSVKENELVPGPSSHIDSSPTIRRKELTQFRDSCEVLNCKFEHGDCTSLVKGTEWSMSDHPIGNPLTGIRGDASLLPYNREGSFVFVKGPIKTTRLVTRPFRLQEDAFFVFAYHKIDKDSTFRVYGKPSDEEQEILLFDAPIIAKNSARRWFREGRMLPSGEYDYISFQVQSLPSNNYIGLDEILVLNKKRQLMCP